MFKKITSILLAISFLVLAISGTIMFFSKKLASELRLDPFHELFAMIMVITGIIHLILNIKPLLSYLKVRKIKFLFASVAGLTVLLYVILMNMELPEKHGPRESNTEIHVEERD